MKTNRHSVRIIGLLIAVTAALVTQSTLAQTVNNSVVFTETSPTTLTVSLDTLMLPSFDIVNTSADHWTVTIPALLITTSPGVNWIEPENKPFNMSNPTGFNTLTFPTAFGAPPSVGVETIVNIVSDTATLGGGIANLVNGATEQVFNGLPDGSFTNYTFNDNAAGVGGEKSVPDTGSTVGLLALALAAVFGASRLRSIRAA
jgi:hypothetical protein